MAERQPLLRSSGESHSGQLAVTLADVFRSTETHRRATMRSSDEMPYGSPGGGVKVMGK